jgi:hypothetical protein
MKEKGNEKEERRKNIDKGKKRSWRGGKQVRDEED